MTTTPNQPDREREAVTEVERDIRIAIWNIMAADGMDQPLSVAFINRAMGEPSMQRALSALAFRDADRAGEEAKLLEALNAAHYYMDATDRELSDDGMTRDDALRRALILRAPFDPSAGDSPTTPLVDDETVERCAAVADDAVRQQEEEGEGGGREWATASTIATAIRALKGSPK